ncbi:MAG: histidine--tRNA ligase [Gemmatimonadota bacterium]|nr:histidine--tRNA ligase [Gemmatimonadota bacterium]MDH5284380.1 histidine--tRNA ligase [Gemmatimonadota bacterium]
MATQPLPGFRDFYPTDFAFRAHIFETWRRTCQRYGFEEYDGPPLEPLELFTTKSGDEIVGQLYNFTDKGGREVALRPEMTPTVARMVAARAGGMKKPIRWFSIAQHFRYERQQRGRLREFYQLNADLIGETGPLADAELIALSIDLVRGFGLGSGDVRVRLSDRRLIRRAFELRGLTEAQQQAVMQVYDKFGRVPQDVSLLKLQEAGLASGDIDALLRLAGVRDFAQLGEGTPDAASLLEAAQPLVEARNALVSMGLGEWIDLDLTIVRGLAYYTGTVFELFDAGRTLRAIAGGGRYDGLLQQLGGVDLPAAGFAIGDVVLGELLRERGLEPEAPAPVQVFVAGVTPEDTPEVLATAHRLREAGFRVEYALRPEAVGKQLKLADARRASLAVVIGPDDRARGEVQLKDLRHKTQLAVAVAELQAALTAALAT